MSAFNQPIFNTRERPMTDLLNLGVSTVAQREMLQMLSRFRGANLTTGAGSANASGAVSPSGFYGDSFLPYLVGSFKVGVTSGIGYYYDPTTVTSAVDGISGLDDSTSFKPIVLGSDAEFDIPLADPTNARIDIIEVRVERARTNNGGRDVLDALTGDFLPDSLATTLNWAVDGSVAVTLASASTAALSYRRGAASVSPVAPTASPGYVALAYVKVAAGATAITADDVLDWRPIDLGYNGLDIVVQATYVGGATGGLASYYVSAPPGIQVDVTDDGVNASFTVVISSGDPFRYTAVPCGAVVLGTSANLMVLEMQASQPPIQFPWWSITCNARVATAGVVSHTVSAGASVRATIKLVPQGSI